MSEGKHEPHVMTRQTGPQGCDFVGIQDRNGFAAKNDPITAERLRRFDLIQNRVWRPIWAPDIQNVVCRGVFGWIEDSRSNHCVALARHHPLRSRGRGFEHAAMNVYLHNSLRFLNVPTRQLGR